SMWRDARDDDDDSIFDIDHWKPKELLASMIYGNAAGIPVFGDAGIIVADKMTGTYFYNNSPARPFLEGLNTANSILTKGWPDTEDKWLKASRNMAQLMSYAPGTWTWWACTEREPEQLYRVGDNFIGTPGD